MIYWKIVEEEREKSQTIRRSGIRCGSSRSAGGAGVGVIRQRVALLASVELPVAVSAPLFDRVRVRMSVG
jgi:hypothetical protein